MSDIAAHDAESVARSVFAGLVPTTAIQEDAARQRHLERSRIARGVFNSVPIILVGSMAAMTLNLTGPVEAVNAKPPLKPRGATSDLGKTIREAMAATTTAIKSTAATVVRTATGTAPVTYTVTAGDTVSDIAGRYGLSTASVLALNGLGWSSIIFPGQQLKLTSSGSVAAPVAEAPAEAAAGGRYTIVAGDTISGIAERHGVSTISVLTANGLGWSSIIYPGQTIAIPGLVGPGAPLADPVVADPPPATPELVSSETPIVDTAPVVTPPVEAPVAAAPVVETPPPAPPAPAPAPANGSYTIAGGDTLSGIAGKFGITTQALLDANGLDWSSVIYSGGILVIPGAAAPAATGGSVTYLNDEMRANAAIIVQIGRELGVPDAGIAIALAAAMQESTLRNLDWGDRDSVGLFQQRPSSGWGSVDLLTTPSYAARLFYGGPSNPNRGYTRGLLDIRGWEGMTLTQAAQAVQISAYPDAYAKWEASAWAWLAELG
ncbi:MAG: LysM peptidoglycan-binding protein [Rhodoglobus sp.]|nr:LysM peptidoglycan-binding protein [Rhodoglobus sp.]